jgi:predicted glycogen debranching enzyme
VKLDAEDGLLFSLEQHRPMTWMNAAVDDWLATPRPGKAIEVQALWYNALRIMAELAKILGKEEAYNRCSELAGHAGANLQKKFWCAETGYIFDCLVDISLTTTGRPSSGKSTSVGDSTLRPNQVIAVGLPFNAFSEAQTRAVVEVATQKLVTPYGLRTLSPDHPAYCGQYTGSPKRLASARHNGCVYPWLIWPFVRAHTRVYKNPQAMQELFAPLFSANESPCIDHIAEMYDGDAPHHPRGVPAYAASTGAILQSWQFLKQFS